MKGEDCHRLRTEILDAMTMVLLCAPDEFPPESNATLEIKQEEILALMGKHRTALGSEEQIRWQRNAEEEVVAACSAYAAGDRMKGASLIQQAQEHFKKSFKPGKIRPGFVVGLDGQAIKT